jgi:glycosyltransferase involved in cell wall biosynthesis
LRTLVWLSTLSYTPNWDGLLRFLGAADGALRAGGFTLRVIGAGGTPAQEAQLRALPYVDYRGFAPDLAEACAGATAAVVPVWSGAGVKLKTLTLMSLGVPVIATDVAMEGIPHEAAARVVATPEDFVAALGALDAAELAAASRRAREVLDRSFSPRAFTAAVDSALEASAGLSRRPG